MGVSIVGRDAELASIARFLDGRDPSRALVITGSAGVGKTTVCDAALASARDHRLQVLSTRAADAETRLAFTGLADLLEKVGAGPLRQVPAPQRRALEIALLRAEPDDAPLEPRAIAAGLLGVLGVLARRRPVVVVIDDAQWLDRSSAEALAFAVRRFDSQAIRFLITRRETTHAALERAFRPEEVTRLPLVGLSLGAVRSLLSRQLTAPLPRWVVRRVFEVSGGNPLLALELGRTIVSRGIPELGQELPRLELEDAMGPRLMRVPASVRKVVLALALSPVLTMVELASVAGEEPLEQALEAGVVVAEGHRARVSHPLLATAALARARAGDRRALHLDLARVASDDERRARHLALGASGANEEVAMVVDAAATRAASRGAAQEAAELAAHALRLTPPDAPRRPERLLSLGEKLMVSGEHASATEVLTTTLDALPPGPHRAKARLLLSESEFLTRGADASERHLAAALSESASEPILRAMVAAAWARYLTVGVVERIAEAERTASDALAVAKWITPAAQRDLLQALALARKLRGLPIDDLCQRFAALSSDAFHLRHGIERIAADRLAARGQITEARAEFERLLGVADERGEAWSAMWLRHQLCELELRAGEFRAASRLLDEREHSPDRALMDIRGYDRCRAQLAAGMGDVEEAERLATRTIEACAGRGYRWNQLQARHARALASLLAHDTRRAAEDLTAVWGHVEREGVEELAEFPVAPDLVEVLVELGDLAAARSVTDRLSVLAEEQEHPWGRATARRCEGLLSIAAGRDDLGMEALAEAADTYEQLGLRFDHARTLLAAGRAARRHRRWSMARDLLGRAASGFDGLCSPGWARDAREELARVSGTRTATAEALSQAERQVTGLAADGLSNKEIAARLVVTVNTVEKHLTHAYAKLGVRSRTQLSSRRATAPGAEEFRISGISGSVSGR